jgi:histone H3/H4
MDDHFNSKLKFNTIAVEQLQVAIEDLLVLLLQNSYILAIHAQRTTLHPKDIATARLIMKSCDSIFDSE